MVVLREFYFFVLELLFGGFWIVVYLLLGYFGWRGMVVMVGWYIVLVGFDFFKC